MRAVELAKVAVAAEALRLRRVARRQGIRAACGAVAAIFAVAALVVVHVVIWQLAAERLTPLQATLVLLVIDAVISILFVFLAMRNTPDAVEEEARLIKTQAVAEMKQSLTLMGMAATVTGLVLKTGAREGVRRGAMTAVTELVSRMARR